MERKGNGRVEDAAWRFLRPRNGLLIAFMAAAAAVCHVAAVLLAMFGTAFMCGCALVVSAMAWGAMLGRLGFVVRTMFATALVRLGIDIARAVFGADGVFGVRMVGAMFRAIVVGQGFVGAVFQTGFIFFAFAFFAMRFAVMQGIGFVFGAMVGIYCRHRRSGGNRSRGRRYCGGSHFGRLGIGFVDRFCRFAAAEDKQRRQYHGQQ